MDKIGKGIFYVVLSAGLVWAFIVIFGPGETDQKIIEQAGKIKTLELEKGLLKKEMADQKDIIELANAKVVKSEKEKNASKLSLMGQEKTFDEAIENINRLRKADKAKFEISVDQWETALFEIEKYKERVIDLDIKWNTAYDDLKELHFKDTGKLIKMYKKMVAKLENQVSGYKILTIKLGKKADTIINFPTVNFNFITLPSGDGYFSAGIGGSINLKRLIKGKLNIPKLLLGG